MKEITQDPRYAGMPDLINAKGEIQWEAPSNRSAGQFKDSHHRRRDWWRRKAVELGIDPNSNQWISRVAKALHPTKKKPCSVCGKILDIRYVYPTKAFIARLRRAPFVPVDYFIGDDEDIFSIVRRVIEDFRGEAIKGLPGLLKSGQIEVPKLQTADEWLRWLEDVFVPSEPRLLSPGVMSNAPDRLDGFHTHNRCCRPTADKGRHTANLKQYVTDRRVFEYWSEGDWVAADRLMGKIRAQLSTEPCRNGHSGPCAADHIGPISLGFCHRPCFQLLCAACNSAKNNRMELSDVDTLKKHEANGEQVISWHSRALWNARKESVTTNETALRLSKQLRDNRHALMRALKAFADAGHYVFLTQFLELERANYDVDFDDLRVENSVTCFARELRSQRTTKYADEQKARRIRIAFEELMTYHSKENRNVFLIKTDEGEAALEKALQIAAAQQKHTAEIDQEVKRLLALPDSETLLRQVLKDIEAVSKEAFVPIRDELQRYMDFTGQAIAARWNDDRYVRAEAPAAE